MGADSVGNEATPEQLDAITTLLHESLDAGGLGFSTTLSFTHSDGDGKPVASRWATQRRSARALPRRERARRNDARVRDRRLPARLHRRRSRADGRDDARRPAAAQLERAHHRLAGAAALPRPGRRVRERTRARRHRGRAHDADPRRDEHVVPQLLRAVHDAGLVRRDEPARAGAHREAPRSRRAQVDGRAGALPRGRRVLAPRVVGSLHDRRHVLRRQRRPQGPDRRRPREGAGQVHLRHARRHRDRRRPAHRVVAAPVRQRPGVVEDARRGVGPPARDDRRLRRRRAPRPHVRRAVPHEVPRRLPARPQARVDGALRAAHDAGSRRAVRAARPRARRARATTPTSSCSIPRRSTPAR